MKKLSLYMLLGVYVCLQFSSLAVFAADPIPGAMSVPWNSSIQPWTTPTDVKTQAQQQQTQALTAMEKKERDKKYSECIAVNATDPNKVSYCNCVADGGVKLNTDVPFVGKCINKTDTSNAFPALIGGLSKMVVTVILIVSFMFVIIGGVQRASGNPKEGKAKITKVAIGLAILGASWAILALINPNFFQ